MIFPIQIRLTDAARDLVEMAQKATANISRVREDDLVIGPTPKEAVYREDNLVLYRYTPVVDEPFKIPVLIVYALVNRPYMVDLQENRSLVSSLLAEGIDVYLIDWGYPQRGDRWLTIEDHVNGYIDNCVNFIRKHHDLEAINLLSICQGGTLSMCYTALHPDKVKNLITMVAPVDFHVEEGMLNVWSGCAHGPQSMDIDAMVDALGNIPGDFMNFGYLMLKPFQLNVEKYIGMADILDDEAKLINFLRMEKWIFDSPDQPGETFRQFLKDFYQENKLVKGEVEIGGCKVNLKAITMPVLNLYAEEDHLVPPASSIALKDHVGTADYTVLSFPVGHIGMYVSGKVQKTLPPAIATWLKGRG
jgi:polyhydroxyalkanoate synthase subunit PhaC